MMRRGVISVYLSIAAALLFSVILVSLESVRTAIIRTSSQRWSDMAAEMVFSGYVQPLADQYGLFVLDAGEGFGRLDNFRQFAGANMKSAAAAPAGPFQIRAEISDSSASSFTRLEDQDWKFLLEQIAKREKLELAEKGLKKITSPADVSSAESVKKRFAGELDQAEQQARQEAAAQEDDRTSPEKDSAQTVESTGPRIEDPRPGIGQLLRRGLVSLVMNGRSVSDRSIRPDSCTYSTGAEKQTDLITNFGNALSVRKKLSSFHFSSAVSAGLNMAMLNLYISDFFTDAADREEGDMAHALLYEKEYILCGHADDQRNLEGTLRRIFALRSMLNLAWLYSSPDAAARLTDAAAQIAVSALPGAGQLVRLLLMVCWAGAEAAVDCAGLIDGKKVPIWKNSSTWNLSLDQLVLLAKGQAGISDFAKDSSSGLDYHGYLDLLLSGVGKDKKIRRMLSLMELNVRMAEGYENFSFANSLQGAAFQLDLTMQPAFWKHGPGISWHLNTVYGY